MVIPLLADHKVSRNGELLWGHKANHHKYFYSIFFTGVQDVFFSGSNMQN